MPDTDPGELEPKQLTLDFGRRSSAPPSPVVPKKEEKVRVLFGYGVALNARRKLEKVLEGGIYDREGQISLFPDDKDLFQKEIYMKASEAERIRDNIEKLLGPEYIAEMGEDSFRDENVLKINKKPSESEPPPPKRAPWEEEPEEKPITTGSKWDDPHERYWPDWGKGRGGRRR